MVQPKSKTSPYQYHLKHYQEGCGSGECKGSRICFARGQVPADVLLCGEAPGESENVIGLPFVGPAGSLLDSMVERAFSQFGDKRPRIVFTNVVGCIPREAEDNNKASAPSFEQVQACKPRLQEFLLVADGKDPRVAHELGSEVPEEGDQYLAKRGTLKAIVSVGTEAQKHLDQKYHHSLRLHRPIEQFEIVHPAYILRRSIVHRDMDIQRVIVTLYNMWAGILDPKSKRTVV